jgi:hypothetical protein
MGFSGLNCWQDSDEAADFVGDILEPIVKRMKKELKNKSNEFNTPGYINVALFFEAFLLKQILYNDELVDIAEKTIEMLEKNKSEWGSEHKNDFNRMIKNLNKFLDLQDN